ncbi:MAG: roadblock/LC7 domain-containing protein [Desulfurococcales archaeon]|nr:roadblock/LC7 domain-containing protein [Desulfurococcales archaeon]
MQEKKPSQTSDLENLTRVKEFVSSLRGLEYLVVSIDGLPAAYTNILSGDAEAVAALSVDIVESSYKTIKEIIGKQKGTIYIDTGEGKALALSKSRELLVTLYGDYNAVRSALYPILLYLEGKKITCKSCNADLTLATYKCPHCSSIVPFVSDECPICRKDISVKKCPSCASYITSMGEPAASLDKASIETSTDDAIHESTNVKRTDRRTFLILSASSSIIGIMTGYLSSLAWGVVEGLIIGVGIGGLIGLLGGVSELQVLEKHYGRNDEKKSSES